jgi:hypothetical protein
MIMLAWVLLLPSISEYRAASECPRRRCSSPATPLPALTTVSRAARLPPRKPKQPDPKPDRGERAFAAYEADAQAAKAVPGVAKYLVGWQRPGDFGFIAERDGEIIGAAWARRISAEELRENPRVPRGHPRQPHGSQDRASELFAYDSQPVDLSATDHNEQEVGEDPT